MADNNSQPQAVISLVLRVGSTGPSVARVQALLKDKGYKIEEDLGYFGYATDDAVRSFQEKSGLRADGVVTPDVWRALESKPEVEAAAAQAMAAARASVTPPAPVQEAPAPTQETSGALSTSVQPEGLGQAQPSGWGKVLVYGGLALLGIAVVRSWMGGPPPLDFDLYEDDYGLPPEVADADDDSDSSDDSTGIVPFGGGPALKRGAGGKFLPRGGKRILVED